MSNLGIVSAKTSSFSGEDSLSEASDFTKQKVEKEIDLILDKCRNIAESILRNKVEILKSFAEKLVKERTLQESDINYLFINGKLPKEEKIFLPK
jgi:ATP-dependent Zn protease